jgi:Ethanolamine utilization protein EutJ (predicted chaperonin)
MSKVTVDAVVAGYIRLRSEKEAIEREMKEQVEIVKAKMAKLEAWFQQYLDESGQTSAKTREGTVFMTTTDFARVADWDAVLDFIKEREAFDLLEKRVSKNAVRGYIDADGSVPPGINYGSKISVNVRRPSDGAE